MWPRSSTGRWRQVVSQVSSAPANDGIRPATGKIGLIRWSYSGPSTPKSASAGPPSSTRT